MKVSWTGDSVTTMDVDALVVGIYADQGLEEPAKAIDQATGGLISKLCESGEIAGKHAETTSILVPGGVRSRHVLVLGLGDRGKVDSGTAFRAAGAGSRYLAGKPRQRVAMAIGSTWEEPVQEAAICGAIAGCHGADLYRARKNRHPFDELIWSGASSSVVSSAQILGDSVNLARRLVNEPPSEIYPESFASRAADVARECGFACEIWDHDRLQEERCGSLLAVAKGSAKPPRLVILTYRGSPSKTAPLLGLVGKGVTFDSGGLSIKPTDGMKTMKCDMAGAATVVAAMRAISLLKLPVDVIGLCGLVENMLSGESYKLGDVLTARSGKTIEVLNTDAEGRLVLADVLDVAVERGAERLIDLATLTGACVVALGNDVAGAMSNHQEWCDTVLSAARRCGEPIWQLPMFSDYGELIKSEVADIKNVGDGRWGGAITAAKFLEEFVAGKPWTHLDIAGPAFLESAKPYLDGGGTGAYVRTLVEVARNWK